MKKEWIKIICIGSVALNLAFFSSGIYKAVKKRSVMDGDDISQTGQYRLTAGQSRELNDVVSRFRLRLAADKSDVLDKRIEIIEMLGDPSFKTEDLEKEILALNAIEGDLNIEFVSTLLKISSILEQDQWIRFLYNLSRSWFFSGFDPGAQAGTAD